MENSNYNPVACDHKLPNGFSAWQFQSEEQSNLGGANKVSIHVCLLCGEIGIGGYRPSKNEKHSNSFHETFNIYHPDAIDAIIKQANFYNEEARWCRADDYDALQAKCERYEAALREIENVHAYPNVVARKALSAGEGEERHGLEWLHNPIIEFCYRHTDGRVEVRYRRIEGTPECDELKAEVEKLIEIVKPEVSPYFYRKENENQDK